MRATTAIAARRAGVAVAVADHAVAAGADVEHSNDNSKYENFLLHEIL
jgi:hypothetical protein